MVVQYVNKPSLGEFLDRMDWAILIFSQGIYFFGKQKKTSFLSFNKAILSFTDLIDFISINALH